MICPQCQAGSLRLRTHESREPHGEMYTQIWYECANPACGEKYLPEELEDN